MKKEIERKYAIIDLPENLDIESLDIESVNYIEQAFIYRDNITVLRIRKIEDKSNMQKDVKSSKVQYIYTVKTKGDIKYDNNNEIAEKYEIESNITKEEYEELLPRKISNIIRKTRIVVPIHDNLEVEIDVYYDYLDGFLTAEVEFPSNEEANNFIKPDWLGEELGYKELSNRKLAEMDEKEFKSKVSEDFMEQNKIIIEKLKKLI